MALTYSGLVTEVLFNSFEGADFTLRAKRYLNEAVNELGRRVGVLKAYETAPFDATGTVTTTQPFYRINEVWLCRNGSAATTELAVFQQADRRLEPLMMESSAAVQSTTGTPLYYQTEHVAGDRPTIVLRVWPVAAQSGFVGIAGRALPPLMVNDSDVSGLGGEFDDALIAFARSRCYRAEDDFQAAQAWMADFEAQVRHLSMVKQPSRDRPIVTPGTWGDTAPISGGW